MSYIGNPLNSVAFLTDQFSGNGSTVNFTMSVAPANTGSVLVAVSGVLQDPSTYAVNGTTLTFSAAPPSGTANVSVRYLGIPASGVTNTAYRTLTEFTATAGQTTFSVPSYTVGFINVYRNGVMLGSADFTASSGTSIVLATGAAAGDLITTESFYVSSVLNAIANTNGSVTQLNLAPNVAGNGPAFSAYANSSTQLMGNNTFTKVQFQVEEFDTNNNYDNATNYRFTPTVAGYYQVSASLAFGTSAGGTVMYVSIYKNGSRHREAAIPTSSANTPACSLSALIYFNGSTDYAEVYCYQGVGSAQALANTNVPYANYFQASLVRAA